MDTELKVPCLRHDFQKEEWSAIGKIIKENFCFERYFPIKMTPVFIKSCLHKQLTNEEIFEKFLKHISRSEVVLP